jgi:UDPglucose 6-dehydrogenase
LKLTIIGTGYVGLVTGACFAEMGNTVTCQDTDAAKISGLQQGRLPIFEPGLEQLVVSNVQAGRLRFTTSLAEAAADSDIHVIAVGTPPGEDGSADLRHVLAAARALGGLIGRDCIVAGKSTVPVGTADLVREAIRGELERRGADFHVDVISNPEFLKEGDAINDFMRPERIIIGTDSEQAAATMRALYAPFMRNHDRIIVMGIRDAEMTKYAANAMLATRISFMNEVAQLCEKLGVDVEQVRRGIGSDSRIGHAFLYPGCGYGGSCFPKDVNALIHMFEGADIVPGMLQATEQRNRIQKERLFEKMRERFGGKLTGLTVAVWGLAFKPGTDDLREAPSLVLISQLLAAGARVRAYDPVAMTSARQSLPQEWFAPDRLTLVNQQYDAVAGADALALVTEWKPFRLPDFSAMKAAMKQPLIFDGRNQYDPQQVRTAGFEYFGIGR